jgi:heme a synthase
MKKLRNIAIYSLISIYLVILAGSVVRMTGSGMGCPDWPKCFGMWIPPTSEDQLPDNYREDFAEKRIAKIERFAATLDKLGFKNDAETLRTDPSLRQAEEPFNAAKTWTEYINRLVGFIGGNLILLVFILSLLWLRKRPWLIVLNGFTLIFLLFQAWFGSIVVATNLTPWTISLHMFFALVIVVLQITLIRKLESRSEYIIAPLIQRLLLWGAIALSFMQILLGTRVRQEVDAISGELLREDWIDNLSSNFELHRSFAILVIILNGGLWLLRRKSKMQMRPANLLMAIIIAEAMAGIILSYARMPAALQPVHLMLATMMLGVQVWMLFGEGISNAKKSARSQEYG